VPDSGSEAATALERLASGGCDIIFSTSSGFYDATSESAKKHPDIKYLFFNGPFGDNLSSYAIRDYEALFVNGYLAAKIAPSGKLGFVAAQPEASVVRAINGFADGAKYANPDATIQVLWVNSWYDPVKEMESAKSLLAAGAEVLGHHSSSPAVEQAVEEAGKYVVGFHVDMRQYAPNANLTSFLWNWEPIFSDAVQSVASGTWTAQNYFWGTEKNCAAIAPINEKIVPPELIAEVNAIKEKVAAKEILVFQGPLSDNHGNEIVAAGSVIEDDKLKDMGFLLSNVVGELP
jgi:basic membrane lipoprotein Med (substrate-binding protein (PBP1-ABC) superfamily)